MVLASAACTGGLVLHAPAAAKADSGCGDTAAGLNLGTGAQTYLSEQVDQSTMKDDGLTGVTKWRQDALDSTAKLWNGQTMKDYLAQHGISQDTYLHPGWNHDLERIAIQRSAEANVAWDHTRPNGQAWSSVTTASGTASRAETLATVDMPRAIDAWAAEKQQVLDNPTGDNSQVAADYLFLINPGFHSYGFADANGNAGIGEASTSAASDDSQVGWSGMCSFHVPTLARDLTPRLSPTSAVEGQTKPLITSVTGTWKGWFNAQQQTTLVLHGDYTSSDTAVASVTDATLTANGIGTTTLSMKSGDQTLQVGQFQVGAGTITSVKDVAVTTPSGTAPVLPATVSVTWKNGGTTDRAVTWGSVPTTWRNRAGGRFTVTGTVAEWGKPVNAVVTVTPATVTAIPTISVNTAPGVAPKLPATVPVTWSNGDTTNESVKWAAIARGSYARKGTTFTVVGVVGGSVPAGHTVTARVTVGAPVAVSSIPVQVRTLQGHAPVLPSNVTIRWSDGTTSSARTTWNAVAPAAYAHPGSFVVAGRAALPGGASMATRATVSVLFSGFTARSGTAPRATGVLGDASGDRLADVWGLDSTGTLTYFRSTSNAVVKVGVRGSQLGDITYLAPIADQNGDGRADMLYRTRSDGSLWVGLNLGNGYLQQGTRLAAHWNNADQVFYAGTMVAGSRTQYVLVRRATDNSLWRYTLTARGLSAPLQAGHGWGGMRFMTSVGNMWGDAGSDVIAITTTGRMYGYRSVKGRLQGVGQLPGTWASTTTWFMPGDLTGDGRPDLVGQRSDGSLWVYANTGHGWSSAGRRATGFSYRVLG